MYNFCGLSISRLGVGRRRKALTINIDDRTRIRSSDLDLVDDHPPPPNVPVHLDLVLEVKPCFGTFI